MITDVPTAESLFETGYGWLNLAWDIAIRTVIEYDEISRQFDELGETFDEEDRRKYIQQFWKSKSFDLNNSLALTHQALEILLKAKIASVSPFLLIANDDRSWPKIQEGTISFYDFKTIEAANLRKIADAVSDTQFEPEEIHIFERLRKDRNRITHLDNNRFPAEIKKILRDIQVMFKTLSLKKSWYAFRRPFIARRYSPGEIDIWGNEIDLDNIFFETNLAIDLFDRSDALRFFGIDKRKTRFSCERCKFECSKYYDGDALFVQSIEKKYLQCAVCGSRYERSDFSRSRSARGLTGKHD